MTDRITDVLARFVERSGLDFPVTLMVSGVRVSGMLTSTYFYGEWVSSHMEMLRVSGRSPLPIEETVDSPSAEQRERAGDSYERRYPTEEEEPETFDHICIRNATVETGVGAYWRTHPFLLINADSVDAMTLGAPART